VTVTVKHADRSDLQAMVELRLAADREARGHTPEVFPDTEYLRFCAEFDAAALCAVTLSQGTDQVWIAYVDGNPAGYLSARPDVLVGLACPKSAFVSGLYVRPEYRRSSILGRLVRSAVAWGRANGIQQGQALVLVGNAPMQGMMRRTGWSPVAILYQRRGYPDGKPKLRAEESHEDGDASAGHDPGGGSGVPFRSEGHPDHDQPFGDAVVSGDDDPAARFRAQAECCR